MKNNIVPQAHATEITSELSRREFLERAGKLAAYTPPTMLALMYPGAHAVASGGHSCNEAEGKSPGRGGEGGYSNLTSPGRPLATSSQPQARNQTPKKAPVRKLARKDARVGKPKSSSPSYRWRGVSDGTWSANPAEQNGWNRTHARIWGKGWAKNGSSNQIGNGVSRKRWAKSSNQAGALTSKGTWSAAPNPRGATPQSRLPLSKTWDHDPF